MASIPCAAEARCTYSFSEQPQTSYARSLFLEQKDGTFHSVARFAIIRNQRLSSLRYLRPTDLLATAPHLTSPRKNGRPRMALSSKYVVDLSLPHSLARRHP